MGAVRHRVCDAFGLVLGDNQPADSNVRYR